MPAGDTAGWVAGPSGTDSAPGFAPMAGMGTSGWITSSGTGVTASWAHGRALFALVVGMALMSVCGAHAAAAAAASAAPHITYRPGIRTYWAFVDRAVTARARPSGRARAVGQLTLHTQDGTDELVLILGSRQVGTASWLRVELPIRPTGATGWIPRSALDRLQIDSTWLRVNTESLRATLVRHGRVIFSAPVGVGKASTPTPKGNFYIRDRLHGFGAGSVYGPVALGLSAMSRVLTDWPGGGEIGLHGTNEPQLIPGRPSHGCIRLHNADALRLYRLIQTGAPVTVT